MATSEIAQTSGFIPVAVTADEEIRGPFLLAQSVFAAAGLEDAVAGSGAEAIVNARPTRSPAGTNPAWRRSPPIASSCARSISRPSRSGPRPPSVPWRC